jgi:RNA polymerase primary sigma factor
MTGISEEKICSTLKISEPLSLDDSYLYNSGESQIIGETIEDKNTPNVEEESLNSELKNSVNESIDFVFAKKPNEKKVITERYGLDGKGERTLEEVGLELDLTRERIRQIEKTAIERLRKNKSSKKLNIYLE